MERGWVEGDVVDLFGEPGVVVVGVWGEPLACSVWWVVRIGGVWIGVGRLEVGLDIGVEMLLMGSWLCMSEDGGFTYLASRCSIGC